MSIVLRLPAVKARTGLSRSSLYLFISRGEFPRPFSLGSRSVGWLENSVEEWISARAGQSREAKSVLTK
jgi:prophage regulatory protein